MTANEIKEKYDIDMVAFKRYLKGNDLKYSETFWNQDIIVKDELIDEYVENFLEYYEKYKKEEQERLEKEAEEAKCIAEIEERERKSKALKEMLITTGVGFEGYRIIEYAGVIHSDGNVVCDRNGVLGIGSKNVENTMMYDLDASRHGVLCELKEEAYYLGCNAIIGVDFDYVTLDITDGEERQPYILLVIAMGTAVVVEKIEE